MFKNRRIAGARTTVTQTMTLSGEIDPVTGRIKTEYGHIDPETGINQYQFYTISLLYNQITCKRKSCFTGDFISILNFKTSEMITSLRLIQVI